MTSWAALAAALVLAFGAAGCGEDGAAGDEPRPAEITISTTIALSRVSVSPSQLGGGGPIELLVSNQTRTSQRLTLQSQTLESDGPQLRQSTGPINPGDSASLKADLAPGSYTVMVGDDAIAPARIDVGRTREPARDPLLQP